MSISQSLPLTLLAFAVAAYGSGNQVTYLALGDSVAYGMDPNKLVPNPPPTQASFVGYPEIVTQIQNAIRQPVTDVNLACPGETSSSFIDANTNDFGCNGTGPQGQPSIKDFFHLLHTQYSGPQLTYALSVLQNNPPIGFITLGIGSNDVLILVQRTCHGNPTCINSQLPGVLQSYGGNLAFILQSLRARYQGTIILVKYYAPSIDLIPIAKAVNDTMEAVGKQFNARFADGFTTFQLASLPYGGDPCKAGLLIKLPDGTCDIHPSPLGRNLLATTVEVALLSRPY